MKILFLCSSLEPGKDGVGDYTRRLAKALLKEGHQVSIIAIHDRHVANETEEVNNIHGSSLSVLRLPARLPSKQRLSQAAIRIQAFNPYWVSLQYVGFGYHSYGLPTELFALRSIIGNAKLHIMFHELWCGMSQSASIKEKILGRLQKLFIRLLLSRLKPSQVFTNVKPYALYLQQFHVVPILAPVFGNIDLLETAQEADWKAIAHPISFTIDLRPEDWLILGFFGAVYPCPGLPELLQNVARAAKQTGKQFGILKIGKSNAFLEGMIKNITDAQYWETGLLPPAMVNRAMKHVNCGVVTTPADGFDKSGSAIAWIERGIPVLVSHSDGSYIKNSMLAKGIVQVESAADVKFAIQIDANSIRQNKRLEENVQLYASLR